MIFFEIRNTYRVSPKGVYSSIKIIFFLHQTVPLSIDNWLPIALRRFLYPMRYLHTALLLVNFMSLTSTALVALRLYLPGEVHVQITTIVFFISWQVRFTIDQLEFIFLDQNRSNGKMMTTFVFTCPLRIKQAEKHRKMCLS